MTELDLGTSLVFTYKIIFVYIFTYKMNELDSYLNIKVIDN